MTDISQKSRETSTALAVAFDPKSPATLIFPAATTGDSDDKVTVSLNAFISDSGIGCNAEETSALMRLIDARDQYLENGSDLTNHMNGPKVLCKTYRRYLIECLQQWEVRCEETDMKQEDKTSLSTDEENIELLKLTHTIMQLCEIYLLNVDGKGVQPAFYMIGPSSTSGIVTADTVRYLRYNHMIDVNAYIKLKLGDDMDMEKFMNIPQPEYFDPLATAKLDEQGLTPYWCLIRKLVLRGCLHEAWAVLSRHSGCKKSSEAVAENLEKGGYIDSIVKEDNEAFTLIRAFMLSAPIPGGRDDIHDDGLGLDEGEMEQEQEELLSGISPDSYKMWDAHSKGEDFNIHAIMNMFKSWKMSLREMIKVHTPLRNLMRRIPMLQLCLWDVMLNTVKSFREEDVWGERLSAELIYVQPEIQKEDIYVRAKDYLHQCMQVDSERNKSTSDLENILLQIMKGNAGVVIQALSSYGGGSSAALPAAMTALLCNLLVESGKIELSQLSFDIDTELLLSASTAILSSFSIQKHSEVGVRLSARLLRPYIAPQNPQVTAYVAEMLGRHWPKSDAETMSLLESCRDAVSIGSKRMLDACDSLAFSRSKHHSNHGSVQKSVYFLLRGIEYISFFGEEVKKMEKVQVFTNSTCFRRLALMCAETTEYILSKIHKCFSAEIQEIDVTVLTEPLKTCRTIVDTIDEDKIVHLVQSYPSIHLLKHIATFSLSFTLGKKSEAAEAIINCLKDRQDVDGSVIILANPGQYGYLLSCAYDILVDEDANANLASSTSSFDLEGMQILFSRFTQYCSLDHIVINQFSPSRLRPDISHDKMRYALGRGLMRSFIVENAKLAQIKNTDENLKHDSLTEEEIEMWLEPSL